jgi:plastocyanin
MPDKRCLFLTVVFLSLPLAADVTVTVGPDMAFHPASVEIAPGETVTWHFVAPLHTTTSDATTGAEVWDSGIVAVNGTFSHTFNTAGAHPYHCAIHSFVGGTMMNGVVNVAAPQTTLTSIDPTSGPAAGGTVTTISGSTLDASCTVDFGGTPATSVAFIDSTSIEATTPAHAAGTVTVTVVCAAGSASLSSAFTFVGLGPTITGVNPPQAPAGAQITIHGTNFDSDAMVTIGGIAASTTFIDATTAVAVVPALEPGPAEIIITNPDQQLGRFDGFTVLDAAAIPSFGGIATLLLSAMLAMVAIRRLA